MKIEASSPLYLNPSIKTIEPMEQEAAMPSFAQVLSTTLSTTNEQLLGADTALQQLASGQATNLHQTMLTLEEAKLSFQFLEQVRNRLMSAYQDILREQI